VTERVYTLVELTASREGWRSLRFSIEVRHWRSQTASVPRMSANVLFLPARHVGVLEKRAARGYFLPLLSHLPELPL
jgi:hypothetical protein